MNGCAHEYLTNDTMRWTLDCRPPRGPNRIELESSLRFT